MSSSEGKEGGRGGGGGGGGAFIDRLASCTGRGRRLFDGNV